MITHLKFAGVPTSDQDRALKFWTEQVGFEVHTDQPMGNQRWIELKIRGQATGIVLFTPEGHADRIGSFFNGSFACDDVQATYRQMKERGVEFTDDVTDRGYGLVTHFKMPGGLEVQLYQPRYAKHPPRG